jgi:hypothetical protein
MTRKMPSSKISRKFLLSKNASIWTSFKGCRREGSEIENDVFIMMPEPDAIFYAKVFLQFPPFSLTKWVHDVFHCLLGSWDASFIPLEELPIYI